MRLAAIISYRGEAFQGFQRQPDKVTVQGELEKALSALWNEPLEIKGAGRTDTGVHALGQVIAFSPQTPRDLAQMEFALNRLLKGKIGIHWLGPVAHDFHPRFQAVSRLYHYYIMQRPLAQVFFENRAWCLGSELDQERMRGAADMFLGEHDFSTFCSQVRKGETRVRALTRFELEAEHDPWSGPRLLLKIEGNAFLRRMVRMLVASLVKVGLGEWTEEELKQRFEALHPDHSAPPAPAAGLYLARISYPEGAGPPPLEP